MSVISEDIDMQDAAAPVAALPNAPSPAVPPVNDNPTLIRVESKVEKKQRELEGWKSELENSQAECGEVSQRYQDIAKMARDAAKTLACANPPLSPEDQQAGIADVNARKKMITQDLQEAKDAVDLAQGFVDRLTAELAELTEETASRDVWRDDKSSASSSSNSRPGLYLCAPNPNNPWHADIVRCLKEKLVPLESVSGKIDFDRLVPKVFTNAPSLESIVKTKEGDAALSIVQGIHRFLSEFEEFHRTHLGRLFPILASSYMANAFRAANLQTSLLREPLIAWGLDLSTQLDKLECDAETLEFNYEVVDTWKPVQIAVKELFKLDLLKAFAVRGLFGLATKDFTDVHAYCTKVELLVDASGLRSSIHEKLVIESLYAGLPDEGQRAITTSWPDVAGVPSIDAMLECVRNARVAFPGTRTNWVDWFQLRFKTLSSKKHGAKAAERDDVPDSRSHAKRPRKDHARAAAKPSEDKSRKPCTTTQCNSKIHSASRCFTMHPELRNAPKRFKPRSSSPVRATASMKLEPIDGAKIAAMKASMHEIRDSSVAGRLEDDMRTLSFSTVSAFSQCLADLDRGEPTKYLCAFRGPAEGDNRHVTKFYVNDKELTALIDPGSTHTYIDTDIARELNLRIATMPGDVKGFSTQSRSKYSMTCDKVEVRCNGRSLQCHLAIMDHLDYYDCIIGMDLFSRLGYYLGGSTNSKSKDNRLPEVWIYDDDKPSIVPDSTPAVENTDQFKRDQELFLKEIQPLLERNSAIDPKSFCDLEMMRVELKVPDDCRIYVRSRDFHAQTAKEEVHSQILKWWDSGVIVPAPKGNPFNNSLTLAARRDLEGNVLKYRVCLDPRALNKQLQGTDTFPLPLISDILQKTAGHEFFSTIDLSQAYHRLPLAAESQKYTAFTYDGQQYMFARAPFGLKPMTSIFQRGMMYLFGDLTFVCIYVDDIVVFSRTKDEHLQHVKIVLDRLTKAKLIVNRDKCHFMRTEIVLLGFVIDKHGRRINPEKVANVKSWAPPTNGKMVQRYVGMFNHFSEYIPLYGTLAAPLNRLKNVKGVFILTNLELRCFEKIKDLIVLAPVLSFPDFKLAFLIATDASNVGIGCVLYQLPDGEGGKVNYISFMARSLQDHERRYPAYKKELLGIIYALKKFHYYIAGRHFTLYTDHKPLTFLQDQEKLTNIIAEWKDTLFSYDFTLIHRPGILNIIPDALSRAFPEELWGKDKADNFRVGVRKTSAITRASDSEQIDAADFALQMAETGTIKVADGYHIDDRMDVDDLPFVHNTVDAENRHVVPVSQRSSMLRLTHSFGHLGSSAMVKTIQQDNKTWPKLKEDCVKWVKACPSCQRYNIARKGYHPLKAIHAELPGEHLAIDLAQFPVSASGHEYALLVVDVCTRFVFLFPLRNKEAASVATCLFRLFCDIGFPKIIQSDNGSEFVNSVISELTKTLSVDHRLSTPYHPRGNGVAERHIKSMKDILRKNIEGRVPEWDVHLPMVQLQMNTKIVSLTNSTPFSLFYGRAFSGISNFSAAKSRLMSDEELEKRLVYLTQLVFPALSSLSKDNQQKMIDKFNNSHTIREIQPGAFVMARDPVATGSMSPSKDGPFKVTRRTTFGAYELQDLTGEVLPRHYAPEQLEVVTQDLDAQSDERYEVQSIVSHKIEDGAVLYKVHWKGYSDDEDSFIPHSQFDSDKLIHQYWKRINQTNPHVVAKKQRKLLKTQKEELKSYLANTKTAAVKTRESSNKKALSKVVGTAGVTKKGRKTRS